MSTNREIAERLGILICDYARDASLDGWMLNSQRKDGSFTNPNAERARQTIIVLEAAKAALTANAEACKAEVEKARREENEACAAIAENLWVEAQDTEFDDGVNTAKRVIAKAIRLGPFARLTAQQGEAERPDTQKGEGVMLEALGDLFRRLEAATGFDRDIDLAIGLTLDGWQRGNYSPERGFVVEADGAMVKDHESNVSVAKPGGMYPDYTESVDNALGFFRRKMPGWSWSLGELVGMPPQQRYRCFLSNHNTPNGIAIEFIDAESPTPAIAVVHATVKALYLSVKP